MAAEHVSHVLHAGRSRTWLLSRSLLLQRLLGQLLAKPLQLTSALPQRQVEHANCRCRSLLRACIWPGQLMLKRGCAGLL